MGIDVPTRLLLPKAPCMTPDFPHMQKIERMAVVCRARKPMLDGTCTPRCQILQKKKTTMIAHIIAVAVPIEPVTWLKISMIGYSLGDPGAASTSPILKSKAIIHPNANMPLMMPAKIMLLRILVAGFWTCSSSALAAISINFMWATYFNGQCH